MEEQSRNEVKGENGYGIYRVISEDELEHTAFLLLPGHPEAKENQL